MNSYRILTLKESDEWSRLIKKLPIKQQDIYYTPEYYSLYENYGDGKAQCFVFEKDGEVALYPFLINSINKLGYKLDNEYFDIQGAYGYNGVVSSSYSPDFINSFHNHFKNYCLENNIIAEFTRFHPVLDNHEFSSVHMDIFYDRKTIILDITKNEDEIWKNSYSSNNRNMIRKALKNNIEITESKNKKDYKLFYKIYIETMDNVNSDKYLYFNEEYFLNFIDFLPDNHKLILARLNNEIIGGMILMIQNEFAHYHLSCRKRDFGKFALNNLFLNYAIKISKKNGCRVFHFGGGNSYDENDTLLKFKSNFSKNKLDFYIGKKIHNPEIYNTIINQWMQKHSKNYTLNKNKLLGYREI